MERPLQFEEFVAQHKACVEARMRRSDWPVAEDEAILKDPRFVAYQEQCRRVRETKKQKRLARKADKPASL